MKYTLHLMTFLALQTLAHTCDYEKNCSLNEPIYVLDMEDLRHRRAGMFGSLKITSHEYEQMIKHFKKIFKDCGAREVEVNPAYINELCLIGNEIFYHHFNSSGLKMTDNRILEQSNNAGDQINVLVNSAHAALSKVRSLSHPQHPKNFKIHD